MVKTKMSSVDNTSPRPQIAGRLNRLLILLFSVLVIPGCNYFILLGYLIGGPPQLQPLFEKETKKSFTDRNIRVAVVCYAPDDLTKFHDNIDQMLSLRLATMLHAHQIEIKPGCNSGMDGQQSGLGHRGGSRCRV